MERTVDKVVFSTGGSTQETEHHSRAGVISRGEDHLREDLRPVTVSGNPVDHIRIMLCKRIGPFVPAKLAWDKGASAFEKGNSDPVLHVCIMDRHIHFLTYYNYTNIVGVNLRKLTLCLLLFQFTIQF